MKFYMLCFFIFFNIIHPVPKTWKRDAYMTARDFYYFDFMKASIALGVSDEPFSSIDEA